MTSTYLYDALGRRVGQTASGLTAQYVYDMLNVAQEQYAGGTVADMLAGLGLDQNFARTDTSGSYAMLPDLLGSTVAMVNSAGGISTSYQYVPFGQTTMTGTSSTNPFQYTGRELDATGLYFMRARYYNPIAQRFISQDPIGLAGGQPNFYAYVFNSPTNFADPLGLSGSGGGGGGPPGACNGGGHCTLGHEAKGKKGGGRFQIPPAIFSVLPLPDATSLAFNIEDQESEVSTSTGPDSYVLQDLIFPGDAASAFSEGALYPPYYIPAIAAPQSPGAQ